MINTKKLMKQYNKMMREYNRNFNNTLNLTKKEIIKYLKDNIPSKVLKHEYIAPLMNDIKYAHHPEYAIYLMSELIDSVEKLQIKK